MPLKQQLLQTKEKQREHRADTCLKMTRIRRHPTTTSICLHHTSSFPLFIAMASRDATPVRPPEASSTQLRPPRRDPRRAAVVRNCRFHGPFPPAGAAPAAQASSCNLLLPLASHSCANEWWADTSMQRIQTCFLQKRFWALKKTRRT